MKAQLNASYLIQEGLEDYREIKSFDMAPKLYQKLMDEELKWISKRIGDLRKSSRWTPIEVMAEEEASLEEAHKRVTKRVTRHMDMLQAKRMARKIGLAYWPALLGERIWEGDSDTHSHRPWGVDPMAFVHAERVLEPIHGLYGQEDKDGQKSQGGWDMEGYYGVSPWMVVRMWQASGCQPGAKFAARVRGGVVGCRHMSANQLVWWAKGIKAAKDAGWDGNEWNFLNYNKKFILAIGRLTPGIARQVVRRLYDAHYAVNDGSWFRPRVADIDPSWVNGVAAKVAKMPAEKRGLVFAGKAYHKARYVEVLTPQYPTIPFTLAREIAMGKSPAEVSGGLTKKQAHQWLTSGACDPAPVWLAGTLGLPPHKDMKVVKWLETLQGSKGRWEAVTRQRRTHMGHMGWRDYTLLDILDEVQGEDIITGSDSVEDVIERANARLGEDFMAANKGDHRILCPVPVGMDKMPRWGRVLRTPAQLVAEGSHLGHCVATYIKSVEDGKCTIVGISTRHGRSTVELTYWQGVWTIMQHRSYKNNDPSDRDVALVKAWVKRLNAKLATSRAA